MRRLLLPLAAAAALGFAAPAAAGDVQCVWDALPPGMGDQFLKDYASTDELPDLAPLYDDVAFEEQVIQCWPTARSERQFKRYFVATVGAFMRSIMERSAVERLAQSGEFGADALQRGWAALSVDERRSLAEFRPRSERKNKDSLGKALTAAGWVWAGETNPKENPAFYAMLTYFAGRAMREAEEAKF